MQLSAVTKRFISRGGSRPQRLIIRALRDRTGSRFRGYRKRERERERERERGGRGKEREREREREPREREGERERAKQHCPRVKYSFSRVS
jgi:hypothetical protein